MVSVVKIIGGDRIHVKRQIYILKRKEKSILTISAMMFLWRSYEDSFGTHPLFLSACTQDVFIIYAMPM